MVKFLVGAAIAVICAIAILMIFQPSKLRTMDVAQRKDTQAIAACQKKVELELLAPTTAKFSEQLAFETSVPHHFDAFMNVDAQNAYGVPVRSNYGCDILEEAGTFTVISMNKIR